MSANLLVIFIDHSVSQIQLHIESLRGLSKILVPKPNPREFGSMSQDWGSDLERHIFLKLLLDASNSRVRGPPSYIVCLFPLKRWLHEIKNLARLVHCCHPGTSNSAEAEAVLGQRSTNKLVAIYHVYVQRIEDDGHVTVTKGLPSWSYASETRASSWNVTRLRETQSPSRITGRESPGLCLVPIDGAISLSRALTSMCHDPPCTKIQQPPNPLPLLS